MSSKQFWSHSLPSFHGFCLARPCLQVGALPAARGATAAATFYTSAQSAEKVGNLYMSSFTLGAPNADVMVKPIK